MNLGKIVESTPTPSLFGDVRQSYTKALSGKLPRPIHDRLQRFVCIAVPAEMKGMIHIPAGEAIESQFDQRIR